MSHTTCLSLNTAKCALIPTGGGGGTLPLAGDQLYHLILHYTYVWPLQEPVSSEAEPACSAPHPEHWTDQLQIPVDIQPPGNWQSLAVPCFAQPPRKPSQKASNFSLRGIEGLEPTSLWRENHFQSFTGRGEWTMGGSIVSLAPKAKPTGSLRGAFYIPPTIPPDHTPFYIPPALSLCDRLLRCCSLTQGVPHSKGESQERWYMEGCHMPGRGGWAGERVPSQVYEHW